MRIVAAKNGWTWLVQGFALFRKNPPMWLFLVFTYWLAVALLGFAVRRMLDPVLTVQATYIFFTPAIIIASALCAPCPISDWPQKKLILLSVPTSRNEFNFVADLDDSGIRAAAGM